MAVAASSPSRLGRRISDRSSRSPRSLAGSARATCPRGSRSRAPRRPRSWPGPSTAWPTGSASCWPAERDAVADLSPPAAHAGHRAPARRSTRSTDPEVARRLRCHVGASSAPSTRSCAMPAAGEARTCARSATPPRSCGSAWRSGGPSPRTRAARCALDSPTSPLRRAAVGRRPRRRRRRPGGQRLRPHAGPAGFAVRLGARRRRGRLEVSDAGPGPGAVRPSARAARGSAWTSPGALPSRPAGP